MSSSRTLKTLGLKPHSVCLWCFDRVRFDVWYRRLALCLTQNIEHMGKTTLAQTCI